MPLVLVAACIGAGCPARSEADCVTMTDPVKQSLCRKQEFEAAPPPTETEAYALVSRVPDDLTRQALIEGWLVSHPGVTPKETEHLCSLLPTSQRPACERHGTAAHLKR